MTTVTSGPDTVALVGRALDRTAAIISAIAPSQYGLATPCPAWDVRILIRHLAGQDLRNFLASARGQVVDWQAPADDPGEDWAAAFRDRARQLLAVWRTADLDQLFAMPRGGQAPLRSRARISRSPSSGCVAGTWPGPPARRPAWTPPWPSTRSPGRRRCSGPNPGDPVRRSGLRCRCRPIRRSTSGWPAGSAAIEHGRNRHTARATSVPEAEDARSSAIVKALVLALPVAGRASITEASRQPGEPSNCAHLSATGTGGASADSAGWIEARLGNLGAGAVPPQCHGPRRQPPGGYGPASLA